MKSKRFRSMNAWVDDYGTFQVFRSYATPIAVKMEKHWITSEQKYSQTTSKQKSIFLRDVKEEPVVVDHKNFVWLLDNLNVNRGRA